MSVFDSVLRWLLPSFGRPVAISQELVDSCIEASEGSHPNEFLCLLAGEKGVEGYADDEVVLTDFYVIPGTKTSSTMATLQNHNIPTGMTVYGSLHSHPNGVLRPSDQDLSMFTRYPVNIIVGAPYEGDSWEVFDSSGEKVNLEVTTVV